MPPKGAKAQKRSCESGEVDYAKFDEVFRSGHHHTPREKALFVHIYERLHTLWLDKDSRERPNLKAEFEFLTGVSSSTLYRSAREEWDNDGKFNDPKKRGSKLRKLEDDFAGLFDWLSRKVESAKDGSWLTLGTFLK